MPKKKNVNLEKQLTIRMAQSLYNRIENTAIDLGLDSSGLMRLILVEKLPEYELRAKRSKRGVDENGDDEGSA